MQFLCLILFITLLPPHFEFTQLSSEVLYAIRSYCLEQIRNWTPHDTIIDQELSMIGNAPRASLCHGHDARVPNFLLPHAAIHTDRYAIGGLIYIITDQDLSLLGYPQSVIMQQLSLYWLSNAVQSNMSAWGASPLLPQFVSLDPPPASALLVDDALREHC